MFYKLSEQLGYSPQYMNKIVKGSENLTLESIVKIEKILGMKLIEVPPFEKLIPNNAPVTQQVEEGVF